MENKGKLILRVTEAIGLKEYDSKLNLRIPKGDDDRSGGS